MRVRVCAVVLLLALWAPAQIFSRVALAGLFAGSHNVSVATDGHLVLHHHEMEGSSEGSRGHARGLLLLSGASGDDCAGDHCVASDYGRASLSARALGGEPRSAGALVSPAARLGSVPPSLVSRPWQSPPTGSPSAARRSVVLRI